MLIDVLQSAEVEGRLLPVSSWWCTLALQHWIYSLARSHQSRSSEFASVLPCWW